MQRGIEQFMWPYQGHFRWELQYLAKSVFSRIGLPNLAPEAYLVGFAEAPDLKWPVCVEPENRGYSPSLFGQVESLADVLFENHPEKNFFHSDAETHRRMLAARLEDGRRQTIAEALQQSDAGEGRLFFVGSPRRVADYRAYPVISVLEKTWNRYPRLSRDQVDGRLSTVESLQRALMRGVLSQASRDLDRSQPPEGMSAMAHQLTRGLIRDAADAFVSSLVAVHGSWDGADLVNAMEAVASQPYEGRSALGSIVIAKAAHPSLRYQVRLESPRKVGDTRSFRKMLEMSTPDLHLVSDGAQLYGLATISDEHESDLENLFQIRVAGRGKWDLLSGSMPLLRMDNGQPQLPREQIDRHTFIDVAERVFGVEADPGTLWEIVSEASHQQHGTMLVVSEDADQEASRLGAQGTQLHPQLLRDAALAAVTSIDGAILLRPDGTCVAVGIILDGLASNGIGDPARGARFNSGMRYFVSREEKCLVVIVSEDGMINLLPNLPRRVKRSEVEAAIRRFESEVSGEIDLEIASQLGDHVVSLELYLDKAQCDRYNAAMERIQSYRRANSSFVAIGWRRLVMSDERDDSLFLPER